MAPHSSILAWRIAMDRGAWWATVHGVTKCQNQSSGIQFFIIICTQIEGFHGSSAGKESACNAGGPSPIPGSGRLPGEGNPLQYSLLENPMDRGAWQATVCGVTKSQTRLSDFQFHSRFVQESEVNRYKTPHS